MSKYSRRILFAKKTKVFIFLITISLFMLTLYSNFKEHQKNKSIKHNVQQNINDNIDYFARSILENEQILNFYSLDNNISLLPKDASNLCYNFQGMSLSYNVLLILDSNLEKELSVITTPADSMEAIYNFLARDVMGNTIQRGCLNTGEIVILDDVQKEKFERIKRLNSDWSAMILHHFPNATIDSISIPKANNSEQSLTIILEQFSNYAYESQMADINHFNN